MAVLADDPNSGADFLSCVKQGCCGSVELADLRGHVAAARPEPLRIVIEMRQINECEIRSFGVEDVSRCIGDPLSTWQSRHRSPKGLEWKLAEVPFESL